MSNGDDIRWERWGAIGGFLYVIGMILLFIWPGEPPQDATAEQLLQFYRDNEFAVTWGAYILVTLAGLGLLWFLGSLRSALRRAEGGTGRLSAIAMAAGTGSLILLLGAAGVFVSTAFSAVDPGNVNFQFDLSTHEMVMGAGFGLFIFHLVLVGALVAATSVVSLRTAVFPKWLGWVGTLVALALVIPFVAFFALFAFWAWVVVIVILLLMGRGIRSAPRGTPPAG
jgi:hypothetical protein